MINLNRTLLRRGAVTFELNKKRWRMIRFLTTDIDVIEMGTQSFRRHRRGDTSSVLHKCFLFLLAILSLSLLSRRVLEADVGKWLQLVLVRPTEKRVVPPMFLHIRHTEFYPLSRRTRHYNHHVIRNPLAERVHVERQWSFYKDCVLAISEIHSFLDFRSPSNLRKLSLSCLKEYMILILQFSSLDHV